LTTPLKFVCITRSSSSHQAAILDAIPPALHSLVEFRQADMERESECLEALAGVDTCLVLAPNCENRDELLITASRACVKAGVKLVCMQSILGADSPSPHALASRFKAAEEQVERLRAGANTPPSFCAQGTLWTTL